ncbi:Anaphase-promoting complex subunit 5 [Sorochytrium milnesiophthora]
MLVALPTSVSFASCYRIALLILLGVLDDINYQAPVSTDVEVPDASLLSPLCGFAQLLFRQRQKDSAALASIREPSLQQLQKEISQTWRSGLHICQLFSTQVHRSAQSPLSFQRIFEEASARIQIDGGDVNEREKSDADSEAGIFIRRMTSAFDDLEYLNQSKLFCAFVQYCQSPAATDAPLNKDHIAQYVEGHIQRLEGQAYTLTNGLPRGKQSVDRLQEHLDAVAYAVPDNLQVHHLRALKAAREGNLEVAVQEALCYTDKGLEPKSNLYHWSAYTLAVIYHLFNMRQPALEYLSNCLTRARKLHDKKCVQEALRLQQAILHQWQSTSDPPAAPADSAANDLALLNQLYAIENMTLSPESKFAFTALQTADSTAALLNDAEASESVLVAKAKYWRNAGNDALSTLYAIAALPLRGPDMSAEHFYSLVVLLSQQAYEQGKWDLCVRTMLAGLRTLPARSRERSLLYGVLCLHAARTAAYRNEWKTFDYALYHMPLLDKRAHSTERFEVQWLRAYKLLATDQCDKADAVLSKMYDKAQDDEQRVRVSHLRVLVLLAANSSARIADALRTASACHGLTKQMADRAMHWASCARLAAVHMRLALVPQALALLEPLLPQVRRSTRVHIRAQVLRVYAECLVAKEPSQLDQAATVLHEALKVLRSQQFTDITGQTLPWWATLRSLSGHVPCWSQFTAQLATKTKAILLSSSTMH